MYGTLSVKKNECKSIFQWIAYKIAFIFILAIIVFVVYNTFWGESVTQQYNEPPYYEEYDEDLRFGRPGH